MSLVDDVAEDRNDADFDKFSDKKSSLRTHLQQREAQAAKLAEALRDFLDGNGDMTAERVASYRAALAEWEGR